MKSGVIVGVMGLGCLNRVCSAQGFSGSCSSLSFGADGVLSALCFGIDGKGHRSKLDLSRCYLNHDGKLLPLEE